MYQCPGGSQKKPFGNQGSPLSTTRVQGLNSGCQAYQQEPSPTKPFAILHWVIYDLASFIIQREIHPNKIIITQLLLQRKNSLPSGLLNFLCHFLVMQSCTLPKFPFIAIHSFPWTFVSSTETGFSYLCMHI